jgi:hypothetical protein
MILRISKLIFIALLFVFIFGLFSVKIWDPDFWWHLKTGEYIFQAKSLPEHDPFAFTSLPKDPINPESKRIKFTLTQYWLAQLIFYWIYKAFSFQGIIYMRAFILTLLILLIYKGIRRENGGFYASLVLLIPAVIIFKIFTGERPQLFSFLFAFLLVYLLEGFRLHATRYTLPATRYLLPIPFLMLIWANMHGGFVLGIIIILVYIISETIKFIIKRFGHSLPPNLLKHLVIIGIFSIILSFINPNGYNVVPVLTELKKSLYLGMITEARPPFFFIKMRFYNLELVTYVFLLSICILFVLINIKRPDLTDILLLSVFTAMSLSAVRAIPFFTSIAALMVARYGVKTIEQLKGREGIKDILQRVEKRRVILKSAFLNTLFPSLISIILLFILVKGDFFSQDGIIKNRYPEGAVKFLKENRLKGNMFNPYVWGGYLIWTLYPEYKVFVDGRGLIEEVFFQQVKIMGARSQVLYGLPEWKAFLKVYEVDFIITFSVDEISGRLSPLIPALMNDSEWHLIYMDNISLIFLRENPEDMEAMKRLELPKEWAWNEVITEATIKSKIFKGNSNFYITIGDAFVKKNSYADAKTAYLKAMEMNPESSIVKEKLNFLNAFDH